MKKVCKYYLPEIIPDNKNKLRKRVISHLSLRRICTCYHPDTINMSKKDLHCKGEFYGKHCLLSQNDLEDDLIIEFAAELDTKPV